MTKPLSEQIRPTNLEDVIGQKHLTDRGKILSNMLEEKTLKSMILFGPPGVGKTTIAKILSEKSGLRFVYKNATYDKTKDIMDEISKLNGEKIILCLDEIQYYNKKQQQIFLSPIENGDIILIAMTTENPYFSCIQALLSRCLTLKLNPINNIDIRDYIKNIDNKINNNKTLSDDLVTYITINSGNDLRKTINLIELAYNTKPDGMINVSDIENITPANIKIDKDSDIHYNLISALQKSIRGSDVDAAVFYLARLLEGGDMISPIRRLLIIAHEDIGLAYPEVSSFVYSAVKIAEEVGLPEARIPLTNAVIYMALCPKSDTSEKTYNKAKEDILSGFGKEIPDYLKNAHSKGYLYPHNYENHYVKQQYLPNDIKNRKYYIKNNNYFENMMNNYWENIKK